MTERELLAQLGYTVDEAGGVVSVRGFGVAISCAADDAATLATLADEDAHRERCFQATEPEAADARAGLEARGYAVTRPDPSADVFDVTPAVVSTPPAVVRPAITPQAYPSVPAGKLRAVLERVDPSVMDAADMRPAAPAGGPA